MDPKKQSTIIRTIVIFSLVMIIVAIALIYSLQSPPKPLSGQGGMQNGEVQIGGDFSLIDQDGKVFSSQNLKGKLSLIYFGFTYCPDICPTTLQKLSTVIETLAKYQIEIIPVFITIDPERDTPAVLKQYLAHFHPKFIGLTGSHTQIKEVSDKFKIYYAKVLGNNKDSTRYMMDHSSFTYLFDKKGKYLKHFSLDTSLQEIVEYIRVNIPR